MLVQCEVPSIIQSNGTTENHIVFNIGCPHNAFLIDISRKAVLNGLQQIALVRMLTYRYVERCGSEVNDFWVNFGQVRLPLSSNTS